jgi:hypothetical protein
LTGFLAREKWALRCFMGTLRDAGFIDEENSRATGKRNATGFADLRRRLSGPFPILPPAFLSKPCLRITEQDPSIAFLVHIFIADPA